MFTRKTTSDRQQLSLFTRKTTIRSATIIPVTQERQQTDKQQLPIHKKDNKQISSNYLFTRKATNR